MAKITYKAWKAAHPDYLSFPDVVAGSPLGYSVGVAPETDSSKINVLDFFTELPAISQTASTIDVSPTGNTSRSLIATVADAPDAIELTFARYNSSIGDDAATCITDYNSRTAGQKMFFYYLFPYSADNTKTEYFEGQPSFLGISGGAFAEARTKTFSVTPNIQNSGTVVIVDTP